MPLNLTSLWKTFARLAVPFIESAAEHYKAIDDNDTGQDDIIGISLQYAADLLNAVLNGQPAPKAPDALK